MDIHKLIGENVILKNNSQEIKGFILNVYDGKMLLIDENNNELVLNIDDIQKIKILSYNQD